jgi:hypothetical protein
LSEDELLQRLDGQPSSEYAPNSRESGIVPSVNVTAVDKPGQFSLRHHGVGEVQSSIGVDSWFPKAASVNEPVELVVSVHVLGRSECMGHTLYAVNNGAGKVVCRINLKNIERFKSISLNIKFINF